MRAALYARFSTDLQRQESIADQLAACRAFCDREGLTVVGEYEDAGISGASIANRPGMNKLLRDARAGVFDVVVAEALDRLSRSQGDTATLFEDLRFLGVGIRTISEGDVEEMAVGLKGTMNALFLRETGRKTRRGLVGVAKEGRHAGGRVYGYRIKRELDAKGELVAGLREIDAAEAEVVRQIFRAYADGLSPRAIAAKLNERGLRAPRGGQWNASTINGNAARGNGVLHNELYRGVLVWGRQTWAKSRETGARRSRAGDASQIIRTEVSNLRIVSDELWEAVRQRYADVALGPQRPSPVLARRAKRLLSGLVRCGECGAPLVIGGAKSQLRCSVNRERGTSACANGRGVKCEAVETRVVEAVKGLLLQPEVIEEALREFQALTTKRSAKDQVERTKLEAELAEVKRRAERLIDQVADGVLTGAAVKDRLAALEASRAELETRLAHAPAANVIAMHPAAPQRYRELIEQLCPVLASGDTVELTAARNEFRKLLKAVVVTPRAERREFDVTVETEMAALVAQNGHITKMGAGTGFEPVTFRL